MPREFYIPKQSTKVAAKTCDAVAYVYTTPRGRLGAAVFYGKQAKPVMHYTFRSEAERENTIRRAFENRVASLKGKAEHKAERLAPNQLKVGDILNTCWGYDQTNREFYEVTAVSGQYVTVCEIGQERETTAYDQGRCVPQSGKFVGKPSRHLVQYGDSITVDGHSANKWNTQTVAGVPVGPVLNWTSYH